MERPINSSYLGEILTKEQPRTIHQTTMWRRWWEGQVRERPTPGGGWPPTGASLPPLRMAVAWGHAEAVETELRTKFSLHTASHLYINRGVESPLQHTPTWASFFIHNCSSVPLGASHLVLIENRERGEERAKEEPGLSEPPLPCTSTEPIRLE